MRLAAALVSSIALHLAVAAIPGLEPKSTTTSSSAIEKISVSLPRTGAHKAVPLPATIEAPADVAAHRGSAHDDPLQSDDRGAPGSGTADTEETPWFGIPLPYYYEPRELTERPRPVTDVTLESPSVDAYPGAGKIVLLLYINEEGKVDEVAVLASDVDSPAVETAVVEQFQLVRFAAGKLNGQAVKSKKKIEVVIKPPRVITPEAMPPSPKPATGS
jgi:hypothetical protein